ncbi:MAG: hypothetical protein OK454_06380 [Thaumarchaeota archaeon]|nr:hypothetical protein [Nitrososphaerota archaeon]
MVLAEVDGASQSTEMASSDLMSALIAEFDGPRPGSPVAAAAQGGAPTSKGMEIVRRKMRHVQTKDAKLFAMVLSELKERVA